MLRDSLITLIEEMNAVIQRAEKQFSQKKSDFYIYYQSDYLQLYEKWDKKRDEFIRLINDLIGVLKAKETKETEILTFDFDTSILSNLSDIDREIETLIRDNNAKTTSLKNDKTALRKELLLSDIKIFLTESNFYSNTEKVKSLKSERDLSIADLKALETQITATENLIETLKAKQKDESKGADRVNSYLELYFGSNEIRTSRKR